MPEAKAHKRQTIPEHIMLARLEQSEQMREFFIQMWKQNPELAKQGGAKVQNLMAPLENAMPPQGKAAKQRGISLIELIMFIVIVAMSLAGILLVMDQVTARSADPLIRKQAMAIAESMLEEIQLQDLDLASCTGALGANALRTGVGCVDDYVGYSTNNGILAFSDNAQVALGSYNITGIAVAPVNPFGGIAVVAPHRAVIISVTVAHPSGETATATGYRTN